MDHSLLLIRLKKLYTSILHPKCWKGLSYGVAPTIEHIPVLRTLSVDGVIDVGANRGQFTLACRIAIPQTPIVAIEPIPVEAERFEKVHGSNSHIRLIRQAIGATCGTAKLHLSQSADSSSLLPIGKRQLENFPNTQEVGLLEVPLATLDSLSSAWQGRFRQLLKLDVQGYELEVLKGGEATLKHCDYVYAECSDIELYEGQSLRADVVRFLANAGFTSCEAFNPVHRNGELIQADYLFSRPPNGPQPSH